MGEDYCVLSLVSGSIMKISKLFHWLYFVVMMLPVFIIPIFAIYSRNENYSSNIDIVLQNNKVLNFNQQLPIQESGSNNGITYTSNNGTYDLDGTASGVSGFYLLYGEGTYSQILPVGHTILLMGNTGNNNYYIQGYSSSVGQFAADQTNYFVMPEVSGQTYLRFRIASGVTLDHLNITPMAFDLTQMYGAGNEPSYAEFVLNFRQSYYPYNVGEQILFPDYVTNLNDSDVGSQFLYTLYRGVDKYFNYDEVFNFGDLYTWININFFSGTASLGFFIFWHLLIYWLLTSILWLLFDVLMYVPNLVHRWLDKASLE